MAFHFTPIAFGVMLVVAVGTLAYTLWNHNSNQQQQQHTYGSSSNKYDYQTGYDTYRWNDNNSDEGQRKRKKKNPELCSICLDAMKDNLRTLECNHVFHKNCIRVWFYSSATCPICRTSSHTQ